MRLVTPPLRVEPEDCFKDDVFDRNEFGEILRNIVVNSCDDLVIALSGNWGEGKTTFVKMWQGLLEKESIPSIYIDAFEHDYVDDAFILIASAITAYAEKEVVKDHQESVAEFKEKVKKVGGRFLSWATKIGIKAATLGVIKEADIDELTDIKADLSKDISNAVGNFIEEKINSYNQDILLIQDFKEVLSALPSKLQKDDDDKPLVIVIDELDRCKPTFAVEIVEKVKHLFSTEKVIFVLVMNKSQLEESIKGVYGQNIDAHTYLQKFLNLEIELPKNIDGIRRNDYQKYIQKLFCLHGLQNGRDNETITDCLEPLARHFNLSLRQLEKVFTNLTVFYMATASDSHKDFSIIVFLAVVKVIEPDVFNQLLRESISFDTLKKKLNLPDHNGVDHESGKEINLISVEYELLSEQELHDLPDGNPVKYYADNYRRGLNLRKRKLIPFFAQRLSLFKVVR